jgi:hypothetical protein
VGDWGSSYVLLSFSRCMSHHHIVHNHRRIYVDRNLKAQSLLTYPISHTVLCPSVGGQIAVRLPILVRYVCCWLTFPCARGWICKRWTFQTHSLSYFFFHRCRNHELCWRIIPVLIPLTNWMEVQVVSWQIYKRSWPEARKRVKVLWSPKADGCRVNQCVVYPEVTHGFQRYC